MRLLIDASADCERAALGVLQPEGATVVIQPLVLAAACGFPRCVAVLLSAGALEDTRALALARADGQGECARLLEAANAQEAKQTKAEATEPAFLATLKVLLETHRAAVREQRERGAPGFVRPERAALDVLDEEVAAGAQQRPQPDEHLLLLAPAPRAVDPLVRPLVDDDIDPSATRRLFPSREARPKLRDTGSQLWRSGR